MTALTFRQTTAVIVRRTASATLRQLHPRTTAQTIALTIDLTTTATISESVPQTVPGTVPPMTSQTLTSMLRQATHHAHTVILR